MLLNSTCAYITLPSTDTQKPVR